MKRWILVIGQLMLLSSGLLAQELAPAFSAEDTMLGTWWRNSVIVKQLGISDEQVSRIEHSYFQNRTRLANLNDQLKRNELELKNLMQKDPIDETAIKARTETIAATRAALETAYSAMMLSMRKALNGQQWATLQEMRNSNIYVVGKDGVKPPRPIRQPMPQYTEEAKVAKIEGVVVLQVIIRKDGTVDSFKIIKGLGYGLDESAMNTIANRWSFEPGTKDGKPVDVQASIEVTFKLF